jgi:hypothetical protein
VSIEVYSKGGGSLGSDDSQVGPEFSVAEYRAAVDDDNSYVTLYVASSGYMQFVFKEENEGTENRDINVEWIGKSDVSCGDYTAYLQIFNYDDLSWETLDSNDSTSSGTEFTLSGSITSNQSDYYDSVNPIYTVRVYQYYLYDPV